VAEKKGLWKRFKELLSPSKPKNDGFKLAYTQTGVMPYYSSNVTSVSQSDTVQQSISAIAKEFKKIVPKHIRERNGCIEYVANSPIQKSFNYINPTMTLSDFEEMCIWKLFTEFNCYIYPVYNGLENEDNTNRLYRKYTAYYPLHPRAVTYLENEIGDILRIRFEFAEGKMLELPYEDIIHIRLNYGMNEFVGGDKYGRPDNEALLTTLKINHSLLESVENGVNSSSKVNGIVKYNTMLSDKTIETSLSEFNRQLEENKSGILGLDMKTEYVPITRDVKLVDKDTLDFIDKKILRNYGVSQVILDGTATAEQKRAFLETTLEPLIVSFNQAFTKVLFSKQQINGGNKIQFYYNRMETMTNQEKLDQAIYLRDMGAITINQALELFGYPPIDGGNRRVQSLNFVDTEIANTYQLTNAGSKQVEQSKEDNDEDNT
jgi:HK97 family phage portal protein